MAGRRIGRREVAQEAGVSETTVSYVLRGIKEARISENTRKHVMDTATRLGYRPSFAARSLAEGKTRIVGLLLPSAEWQFQAYYSRFISGLVHAADNSNYHFLYLGQDRSEKYIRCIDEGYVDGMIVLQSLDSDIHLKRLIQRPIPVVTLNYRNSEHVPYSTLDYEDALDQAYRHLLDEGRRNIRFIFNKNDNQANKRKIARHYVLSKQNAEKADIRFTPLFDYRSFHQVLSQLLQSDRMDGIVFEGLVRANILSDMFAERGVSIGEDCSVVCFNEAHDIAQYPDRVRVLDAQAEKAGEAAWEIMSSLLEGREPGDWMYRSTRFLPAEEVTDTEPYGSGVFDLEKREV